MVGSMATSKRVYAKGDLPVPQPLCSALPTHTSTGGPPTRAGSFGSVSCGVTAPLCWVMVHAKCCVCPPRPESLLPPALWEAWDQIPLALEVRFPQDSQSLHQVPWLGSLTWGPETSQQCKNFLGIIFLPSVGHPPDGFRT